MKQRSLKALEVLFFIVLAGSFLFFVPIGNVIDAIWQVSAVHFWISCLLYLPVTYLSALRLYRLVNRQGIHITRPKLFEIALVVKFYSFFSPASMVGSLMRWYKLSAGGKSAEALSAVTVNRLLDVFIAVLFGLFWATGEVDQSYLTWPAAFVVFITLVIAVWLIVPRYAPPILESIAGMLETSSRKWLRKSASFLERLSSSLLVYSKLSALDLILLVFWGLVGELISLLALVYLAQSVRIPVSFAELGWMKSLFFLASLTPFTMAGGLGLREVSVVLVLSAFGIPAGLATAFSFLMYVRGVIVSLLGGILELFIFFKVPSQERT